MAVHGKTLKKCTTVVVRAVIAEHRSRCLCFCGVSNEVYGVDEAFLGGSKFRVGNVKGGRP